MAGDLTQVVALAGVEVVEDADAVPAPDEGLREMAADEPRAAGDKDAHGRSLHHKDTEDTKRRMRGRPDACRFPSRSVYPPMGRAGADRLPPPPATFVMTQS